MTVNVKRPTMTLPEIANIAEALAVIFAVVFGIAQFRQIRRQRTREASFALMKSLMTKDMLRALAQLDSLPAGLGRAELAERTGDGYWDIQLLLGAWESLGILVFHGEIPLDLVDDFYSGPIVQSWNKLGRMVEDIRSETGRSTRWEYFQWLSQRMIERESTTPPVPAYVENKGTTA